MGRGVRNFDSAVWDRTKRNAVLAGTYAKFTHNPALKNHLLSTGNKLLAKACPLDPVWDIGLRAEDPRASEPRQWSGTIFPVWHSLLLTPPFAKVRPGRHTRPPLADSAFPPGMLESTRFRQRHSRARYPRPAVAKVLLRIFDLFVGRAGRPKPLRFGDGFWRRSWPCAVRTRPLPRRGSCDARLRFVHHQNRNTYQR